MMSTNAPCSCTGQPTKTSSNEFPRYYARQLVTADDMTLEQDYFRARMRRHNRFLHGWGVVCGARVVNSNQPWKVIVKSGYILDPCGNEIYIEKDQCIDVRVSCTPSPPALDNGCAEAKPAPTPTTDQFVVVRYQEIPTNLVRVPLGGCGCEDTACEYSRFRDGYQICILDHCPSTGTPPRLQLGFGPPPDCPPCPDEPWVGLASFTVNAEGAITIKECDCRRQVVGFASKWWACTPAAEGAHPQPSAEEHSATAQPRP
jgi:hypothetical protein